MTLVTVVEMALSLGCSFEGPQSWAEETEQSGQRGVRRKWTEGRRRMEAGRATSAWCQGLGRSAVPVAGAYERQNRL